MKNTRLARLVLFAGLTLLMQPFHFESFAQEGVLTPQGGATSTNKDSASDSLKVAGKSQGGDASQMPLYKAPLRGAPAGRLSGGTRGVGSKMLIFAFLAPRHTGLTLSEQPTLYWFSSETAKCPVDLTLLMGKEMKSILLIRIADETLPGFHPIHLADYGIRLQTGMVYQCFISMVTDPKHPSRDIISGGAIERIAYPKDFQKKLKETDITRIPHVYAAEGLWYDAMNALCSRIEAAPQDALLHQQRISLLKQGNLTETADYETAHGLPALHP